MTKELVEHEVTGLIYKVANELQGFKVADKEAQATIKLIGDLRVSGKLTEGQKKILDEMGRIAAIDYDGF